MINMPLSLFQGQVFDAYHKGKMQTVHTIIYLSDCIDDKYFDGIMITSSNAPDHFLMPLNYFDKEMIYENIRVVGAFKFIIEEWSSFNILNNLTQEGLDFINNKILPLGEPKLWMGSNQN